MVLQLDPYYVAPLWPDSVSVAALQARAWLDAGHTEAEMAEVAARSRKAAMANPNGAGDGRHVGRRPSARALPRVAPAQARLPADLRRRRRGRARRGRPGAQGVRAARRGSAASTTASSRTASACATSPRRRRRASRASAPACDGTVDVAELHAPFTHQELILREALGLADGVDVNPSGGALAANLMMAAGLTRVGEAAQRIIDGRAGRAVAHATSGPCLQQNLVCVLDTEGAA